MTPQNLNSENPPAHLWRDGKYVVLHRGTFPPDRCYKCNQVTGVSRRYVKLTFYPNSNILLALGLLFSPVTIVQYVEFELDLVSCWRHRLIPVLASFISVIAFFGGLIWFFAGIFQASMVTMVAAIVVSLGGLFGVAFKPQMRFIKYDGPFVWISGYGKEFLQNLPPWPGIQ